MTQRIAPPPHIPAIGRGLRALIGALLLGALAGCGGGATGPGGGILGGSGGTGGGGPIARRQLGNRRVRLRLERPGGLGEGGDGEPVPGGDGL
ncbi:MAG: hypothetical protein ACO2ZK_07880, partial [Gemmobacter sp.]